MNKAWPFYVENTGLGGGRSFKRKLKINPNGCRSWYDYLQFQNRCPTHPTQKQLSQWAVWGLIPLLKWLLLWGNDKTCICHRICILGVILLNSGDHTSSELGRVIGWLLATRKNNLYHRSLNSMIAAAYKRQVYQVSVVHLHSGEVLAPTLLL